MMVTIFRAMIGFTVFVLATAFAILAAPILLPTLVFLSSHPKKQAASQRRVQPILEKSKRISVSA